MNANESPKIENSNPSEGENQPPKTTEKFAVAALKDGDTYVAPGRYMTRDQVELAISLLRLAHPLTPFFVAHIAE